MWIRRSSYMMQEFSEKRCVMCLIKYITTTDEYLKETGGTAETELLETWQKKKVVWKTQIVQVERQWIVRKRRLLSVKQILWNRLLSTKLSWTGCIIGSACETNQQSWELNAQQSVHLSITTAASGPLCLSGSVLVLSTITAGLKDNFLSSIYLCGTGGLVYSLTILLPIFKYKFSDINKQPNL